MRDRVGELEERVAALSDALARVEERLGALEKRPEAPAATPSPPAPAPSPPAPAPSLPKSEPAESYWTRWATAAGRSLVVFGGAFLLRALTEGHFLPQSVGVPVGFVYAAIWLAVAYRAGRRADRRSLSVELHGVSYVLIAFPILGEAIVRLHYASPTVGAAGVVILTCAPLLVAFRRDLHVMRWAACVAAITSAAVLALVTKVGLPYVFALVALGIVTAVLELGTSMWGVRWIMAVAADVAVLFVSLGLVFGTTFSVEHVAAQFSLFVAYVGLFIVASWARREPPGLFAWLQASVVVAIGYLGGVMAIRTTGSAATLVGIVSVVLSVAAYCAAFIGYGRRVQKSVEMWFYSSVAIVMGLAGMALVLDYPARAWAGIAVLAAVASRRFARDALIFHAALYAVGAAFTSGLFAYSLYALAAPASAEALAFTVTVAIALAASSGVYLLSLCDGRPAHPLARAAGVLGLSVALLGLAGVVIDQAAQLGNGRLAGDPGSLAALRTVIIAVSAVAVAAMSRVKTLWAAGVLVYPILTVGALKMIIQDLPNGSPLAMAIAFSCYGGALIAATRLRRSPGSTPVA